jgi:hypothetical protein
MRKKIWLIVIALFLSLGVYLVYDKFDRARRLKQSFGLVKGEIVDVRMDLMNGHSLDITYKVNVDGKEITRSKNIGFEKKGGLGIYNILNRRPIDVVYEKGDPENCDLLLRRSDYKEYKLIPSRQVVYMLDALEAACGIIE